MQESPTRRRPSSKCRVALVGSFLPRPCGIATFTGDVLASLRAARPDWDVSVVAVNEPGGRYDYPTDVRFEIDQNAASYRRTARYLNANHFDAIFLQHEYGLFGGPAGEMLFELLDNVRIPLVSMLHTVLKQPDEHQFRVMRRLASRSSQLVTMSETGRRFLEDVFEIEPAKISVMPHGIPDTQWVEPDAVKPEFDLAGRKVALTFGLLSPGKGLEYAIEAMPAVARRHPELTYVILGATHPNLVAQEGERYRESLQRRVDELGIGRHVRFVNKFVELDDLTRYIAAADVYLTPYLNEAQITSGTLAYAYGCGKAVVSTPYWHAADLLDDGRGRLVEFRNSEQIGEAISSLFDDVGGRQKICQNAYREGREMTWPVIGHRMAETVQAAHNQMYARVDTTVSGRSNPNVNRFDSNRAGSDRANSNRTSSDRVPPTWWSRRNKVASECPDVVRAAPNQIAQTLNYMCDVRLDHLSAMTDDTGLIQHAVYDIPNWHEGYCVDDNARGLLLTSMMPGNDVARRLHRVYRAFVHYAVDGATGLVRNFMGFDRRFLETRGSDDSIGRTAWALGACVGRSDSIDDQDWAAGLFEPVLERSVETTSPRTWAFAMLAADEFLRTMDGHRQSRQSMQDLGRRLVDHYNHIHGDDWHWFEDILTYDNAKLPHALLTAGRTLGDQEMIDVGVKTMSWLTEVQTDENGNFRPIGNHGFYRRGQPLPTHDQQPLEAWATVSACLTAASVTGDDQWEMHADLALAWFLGRNELRTAVVDVRNGACHDGVQYDRVNRNRGAESTLAWLLAAVQWNNERSSTPSKIETIRPLQSAPKTETA